MIDKKIEELFDSIRNSDIYKKYLIMIKNMKEDKDIMNLLEEIKTLQKEATNLEYHKDIKNIEIDKIIKEKIKELYSNYKYQEYLNTFNELNEILKNITFQIEKFIIEKI